MAIEPKTYLEQLKTYILEQGREYGTVSGEMAMQDLQLLAEIFGIEGFSAKPPPIINDLDGPLVRGRDNINHPHHYNDHPSGVECITIVEWFNFNLGNAIKYIWRAGLKSSDPIEDLKKAVWYVNREIERLGEVSDELAKRR